MATLYRAETTLQEILGMKVGDELKLAGGDLPDYTEDDAGKALQVNQAGTGLEWGPGVPSYTSSDVGKVLTVGEDAEHPVEDVVIPEQTVTTVQGGQFCYAAIDGSTIDWASAKSGDSIKLTINGTDYQAAYDAVTSGFPAFVAASGNTPVAVIGFVDNQVTFLTPSTGDYAIKATAEIPGVKPVWGDTARVVYDELDGKSMKNLTVSEAFDMFSKGYIVFTNGTDNSIMMLTNITFNASQSNYSIYYNFGSSASFTNVNGDSKVPVIPK